MKRTFQVEYLDPRSWVPRSNWVAGRGVWWGKDCKGLSSHTHQYGEQRMLWKGICFRKHLVKIGVLRAISERKRSENLSHLTSKVPKDFQVQIFRSLSISWEQRGWLVFPLAIFFSPPKGIINCYFHKSFPQGKLVSITVYLHERPKSQKPTVLELQSTYVCRHPSSGKYCFALT